MTEGLTIREIPIARIRVLNPRSRGRRAHDEIVESMELLGLKRPITVAPRQGDEGETFDLICGQGRLEAFQRLGQDNIPAVILDLTEEQCLVCSLVENVARRRHNGPELVGDVLTLRRRGYSDEEIAGKIGLSTSWVHKIAVLLERGEVQLIRGVEAGYLPLSLAVLIACEPDGEVQALLAGAYASGALKAADTGRVRRMLARRAHVASEDPPNGSPQEVLDTLQAQAQRHRIALKRANLLQARLAFIVAALRDLRREAAFTTILEAHGLRDLPKALAERIAGAVDG